MSEKYQDYTAEEFAADDFFREWVLDKKMGATRFWKQWLGDNPGKRQEVLRAVALLTTLHSRESRLSTEEIDLAVGSTIARIGGDKPIRKWYRSSYWRWARYAAVFLLFIASWWLGTSGQEQETRDEVVAITGTVEWIKVDNSGATQKEEVLPDGSRVILDPNSTIQYSVEGTSERVVLLSGSAFFDVVKSPGRSFKVVTENLVTQVLGTSFKVSSDAGTGETKVRVVTGKVEVSARTSTNRINENTIVYPNQEIVFTRSRNQITKALVAEPLEVLKAETEDRVYEDIPIGRIFEELALRYGVTIHYDRELLADCQINASFSNETFREKLSLVCRPVRGIIEERNGEVYVKSPGCQF